MKPDWNGVVCVRRLGILVPSAKLRHRNCSPSISPAIKPNAMPPSLCLQHSALLSHWQQAGHRQVEEHAQPLLLRPLVVWHPRCPELQYPCELVPFQQVPFSCRSVLNYSRSPAVLFRTTAVPVPVLRASRSNKSRSNKSRSSAELLPF
jgi:hypothetical protein